MIDSKLVKSLFILAALLMSATLSAQGRGGGGGGGDGQGRSGQHMGRPGQKTQYKNVNHITVYSSNGVEIYSAGRKSPNAAVVAGEKIEMVETTPKGVRIHFVAKKDERRVVVLKCQDCIVMVDHIRNIGGVPE